MMSQTIVVCAGAGGNGGSHAAVYMLFILAGLLTGGMYSAYKARAKVMTIVLGIAAAVVCALALSWMMSALRG